MLNLTTAIVGLLVCMSGVVVGGNQKPPTPPLPKAGVCLREGGKLVEAQPVQIGNKVRAPKKIKNVPYAFPELPPSTRVMRNVWTGEVLIDQDGNVREVWPTRHFQLEPPFPPFNDAVVTAIRQWVFEPALVDKKPVPACMSMSVIVDFG